MPSNSTKEKLTMTFEEYDALVERMAKVELHANVPFWPTVKEIKRFQMILPTIEMTYFLVWLTEMNGEPQNVSERESMAAMRSYLYENLQLVESQTAKK